MTSPQHQRWLDWGIRWHLALPLVALQDCLRGYGYVVDAFGDARHLDAEPPEDHTPYSETGWPIATPYGWVTALDVLAPPAGSTLPSLAQLGGQLYRDRVAGDPALAWLKYQNWEPGDGACWHDSWTPEHVRRPSTDRGHLHDSCRSDMINSNCAAGYDPVARYRASIAPPLIGEPDMIFEVSGVPKGQVDVAGKPVPEHGQCLATPSGPFGLTGSEFFSLPAGAQLVRIKMPWSRLVELCNAHNTNRSPAPTTPAP